ncbi:MAG TPA: hypothetical protein VJ724_01365 [Tahibacter sp.]|nr:hypothetical protein [Tahibacter sp.]
MCYVQIAYIAAAALTAYSGYESAQAQKKAADYNYAIAQQAVKVDEARAQDALNRGAQQANEQRMRTRLAIGSQRAALAAQNVDLQTGTPLDIIGDTAMFGAIDESRIRENAAREAWGYQVGAVNSQAQGALDRYRGQSGARATYLTTAANLGQSAYTGYNTFRRTG